jgi:Ca2+-transporting ATPase
VPPLHLQSPQAYDLYMQRETASVADSDSQAPWAQNPEAVVAALESDPERGILNAVAEKRFKQYGPNMLSEAKRRSRFVAFLMQFADWMIGLLAAAAATSAAIGECKIRC